MMICLVGQSSQDSDNVVSNPARPANAHAGQNEVVIAPLALVGLGVIWDGAAFRPEVEEV